MEIVKKKGKKASALDKYDLYMRAVQDPVNDALFFLETFIELRGRVPRVLREDFCGTFRLACEWVKLTDHFEAYGLDLDAEPLAYGRKNYLPELTASQKRRLHIRKQDVLAADVPLADLIAAMNFSFYLFHDRTTLKRYFASALKSLKSDGIFLIDCFGGSETQGAVVDETDHPGFTYLWDQTDFDPVTHRAKFHIHFRLKDGRKLDNAFTYDWRMWSIPELRELLIEVGFKSTQVYWEGIEGEVGNGEFTRVESGESCEGWTAYIAAER